MNTKTLLLLLLCGVCFACNAPQQDGQETDLIIENKNMTNEQLREKLALALEDMKAKAIEMGIEGVATASVLNNGDSVDWIGEMKVVGSYCNWKDGFNLVAVAWSKCGEVIATQADSGDPNHKTITGELGYAGGAYDVLLFTTVVRAQYNQVNDIPYREAAEGYAQERCKLDVYYPTNAQDAPVVVWFHGGGIEGGEKHIDPQLKNSGLVVVAANYRLLPKAPIDDILDDAAAAVAWTYKNIAKYNGSKRKIFVAGHSAGGYLLDMIGLDKRWLAKYGVDADSLAALVPFSGQCVTHYNIRKQQGIGPLQATIDQYAPLTYVRPDAPPIVIISGDRELELYGRYEEQAYFWRMLKLVGHKDVTLYEMQGYDHGAMPFPAYKILKDHIRRITAKM